MHACRYGAIVLGVEILGGLAMIPYALCLVARVVDGAAPPPDDKGQVGGGVRWVWCGGVTTAAYR